MTAPIFNGRRVPWNAAWSSEMAYEIRTCRFAAGRKAVWQPHTPGVGEPIFAKPHNVRQRRAIFEMRCTVCGERTPEDDRWWFKLGAIQDGWFLTTEAPVHRACADFASKVCPHLRGRDGDLEPFPHGARVISAIVGGPAVEQDFHIRISPHETVIGSLKLGWPAGSRLVRSLFA